MVINRKLASENSAHFHTQHKVAMHHWYTIRLHGTTPITPFVRRTTITRWRGCTTLEVLKNQLGINEPKDWYDISWAALDKSDAQRVISTHYNNSLLKALETHYPHEQWNVLRFKEYPRKNWDDRSTHLAFFEWLYKKLQMSSMEDWYGVSPAQVEASGGGALLKLYQNSLGKRYYHCSYDGDDGDGHGRL